MNEKITQLDRARAVTPGASQTASRQHGKVGTGFFPAFATCGSGAYLQLGDGGSAIDLAGANGTVPLGYNHPAVLAAVMKQVEQASSLSLPTHLEAEVSERLTDLLPFPAKVRWVRTGSEAVSAAVAISQQITKRTMIGVFDDSYHGWHPWTRQTIRLHAGEINHAMFRGLAAVIVESPRWKLVDAEYASWLADLRLACDSAGSLLVFDDVVYAFRFHRAGLQGSTGVRPDLACFSKALGNGFPVACIAGEPALMDESSHRVSSTFGGEATGLAAANAVLILHQADDICGRLQRIGVELQDCLRPLLMNTSIALVGTPQHFRFEAPTELILNRFLDLCIGLETDALRIEQGAERLLIHKDANNINLSLTDKVINQIAHTVKLAATQARL
jgi:glutamate-1-semialdehyde aminotransferase